MYTLKRKTLEVKSLRIIARLIEDKEDKKKGA
jgi:vacuolar-type H+-ATPase subunit C/Vma6